MTVYLINSQCMISRARMCCFSHPFFKNFKMKVTAPGKEVAAKLIIMKGEKKNLTFFCTLQTFYLNNTKCHQTRYNGNITSVNMKKKSKI